ncbi:MAG: hypothetical protein HY698_04315 [Deltaproteobacteria bacterium]|nr:hypothetical protein [Deltaproteobacteria bacterium]
MAYCAPITRALGDNGPRIIHGDVFDAHLQAREILAQARKEAAEILAQAEAALEAARRLGHEQGRNEGLGPSLSS